MVDRAVRARPCGTCRVRHLTLRPRKHDAGRLEHRSGPAARDDRRLDRRADQPARLPRRPDPRPAHSGVARRAVTADARGDPGPRDSRRRSPRVLARSKASRVRARGRARRVRVPRVPVGRVVGDRRDASRRARDPARPVRHLVSRRRPAPRFRSGGGAGAPVRRAGRVDHRRARSLVRDRARTEDPGARNRSRGARLDTGRRPVRRPALRGRSQPVLLLLRLRRWIAQRVGPHGSHRPDRRRRGTFRPARPPLPDTPRGPAPRDVRPLAAARFRGAPADPRQRPRGAAHHHRPEAALRLARDGRFSSPRPSSVSRDSTEEAHARRGGHPRGGDRVQRSPRPGPGSRLTGRQAPVYSAPHCRRSATQSRSCQTRYPSRRRTSSARTSRRGASYSVPIVGRAEWAVVDTWNPWIPSIGRLETSSPTRSGPSCPDSSETPSGRACSTGRRRRLRKGVVSTTAPHSSRARRARPLVTLCCSPRARLVARRVDRDRELVGRRSSPSCATTTSNFRLARFDLGNMMQAVWSTTDGQAARDDAPLGEQLSRLALHVDPILAAPRAPLDRRAEPADARRRADRRVRARCAPRLLARAATSRLREVAALLALAYLAYPWLGWSALDAIHPVTLAIPLLLFAIWFLETGRLWPVRRVRCPRGALRRARRPQPRRARHLALARSWPPPRRPPIAAAGLRLVAVRGHGDRPGVRGRAERVLQHYEVVGGSPGGIVRTAFTRSTAVLSTLTSGPRPRYALVLLSAARWASSCSRPASLPSRPAAPRNQALERAGVHRTALPTTWPSIIPFLVGATVFGLARASAVPAGSAVTSSSRSCLASAPFSRPWRLPAKNPTAATRSNSPQRVEALREAVALVPATRPSARRTRRLPPVRPRRYS